ncbi:MAG TPA: hypothetical protein DCY13_05960 [Verrucomicrobiales bacterium]|nr:hypothetical protein [Verrucomicrobiales bacterium]
MSWILLSICSALFLGVYDLLKKSAMRGNAVLPVLFFGVIAGALVWLPLLSMSRLAPESLPTSWLFVEPASAREHLLLLFKSVIAASAWVTGYFALKHLPVSIASPIRATSPVWTILVAVLFLGESPSPGQWIGMLVILAAFYAFSLVGRLEGIQFHRDKWVGWMFVSALLSSASALYDKHLLQGAGFSAATVQCWFSLYLVVVLAPFYLMWRRGLWLRNEFSWRWSIPLIGLSLLVADFLYFTAIEQEGALISVISPVRRASVVVTFLGGILLFGEKNWRLKALCIVALMAGVALLNLWR